MTASVPNPTSTELEILRVLWDRGPSTVREVHETLAVNKPVGYTTVLKLLQIMTTRGFGPQGRKETEFTFMRLASQRKKPNRIWWATYCSARLPDRRASMMHALSGRKASRKEIDEIRCLLDEYERKTK